MQIQYKIYNKHYSQDINIYKKKNNKGTFSRQRDFSKDFQAAKSQIVFCTILEQVSSTKISSQLYIYTLITMKILKQNFSKDFEHTTLFNKGDYPRIIHIEHQLASHLSASQHLHYACCQRHTTMSPISACKLCMCVCVCRGRLLCHCTHSATYLGGGPWALVAFRHALRSTCAVPRVQLVPLPSLPMTQEQILVFELFRNTAFDNVGRA